MRIISGKYKGMLLPSDKLKTTRPTTDFARTGLFNMLESRIEIQGISALDLFSGSGSVGFELLSRGAAHVTFVDNDRQCIRYLRKTIQQFDEGNSEIIQTDVFRFLRQAMVPYDLVFADPPFDFKTEKYEQLIQLVLQHALLTGGYFILEHLHKLSFKQTAGFSESRTFGNSAFSFFKIAE